MDGSLEYEVMFLEYYEREIMEKACTTAYG